MRILRVNRSINQCFLKNTRIQKNSASWDYNFGLPTFKIFHLYKFTVESYVILPMTMVDNTGVDLMNILDSSVCIRLFAALGDFHKGCMCIFLH